jgi:predicted nucleotidyltransferase
MFINSKQYVYSMATLFSRERERIIEYVLSNPTEKTKVRELAKHLGLSPAHVSRTLRILAKNDFFKKDVVDMSNPYVRSLKTFLNLKKLKEGDIIEMLKKIEALGAGVYGSWSNGTNNEDSDLDVWIKVREHPGERKVAALSNDVRKILGRNVQILILTPERIDRLKKEDPVFYYSLVFGSMTLYGEAVE